MTDDTSPLDRLETLLVDQLEGANNRLEDLNDRLTWRMIALWYATLAAIALITFGVLYIAQSVGLI